MRSSHTVTVELIGDGKADLVRSEWVRAGHSEADEFVPGDGGIDAGGIDHGISVEVPFVREGVAVVSVLTSCRRQRAIEHKILSDVKEVGFVQVDEAFSTCMGDRIRDAVENLHNDRSDVGVAQVVGHADGHGERTVLLEEIGRRRRGGLAFCYEGRSVVTEVPFVARDIMLRVLRYWTRTHQT